MTDPLDLTTLANAKAWIVIKSTDDDVLLQRLITSSSRFMQSWLNRKLPSMSYTSKHNGNGNTVMHFNNYPVTAVASLQIGTQVIPASDGQSSGYLFDEKFLYLIGYRFDKGPQNVAMTYTAGYAAIPYELEQACIELVALRYKERERIGQVSKSLGGEVVSYSQKDMADDIKTILQNYKKVIPTNS